MVWVKQLENTNRLCIRNSVFHCVISVSWNGPITIYIDIYMVMYQVRTSV